MKKSYIIMLCIVVICVATTNGDSIWAKRDKNLKHAFTDDVARKIGDILTVTISETTSIDSETKRDMTKSSDRSTTFDGIIGKWADIGEFGISAESSNNFAGDADYEASRSFTDSITVVVVDILPNGNLVIMGNRSRKIEGDIQTLEVSGIVRPSDIDFANIVASEKVADFRIFVKNSGISANFSKPGWLEEFFNKYWPF